MLVEVLVVFGAATVASSVLFQIQGAVPFIKNNLHGLIAAIFLFVPTEILIRKRASFTQYGLTHRPLLKGLGTFLIMSAVVFPLFTLGFYIYYRQACAAIAAGVTLPRQVRVYCAQFVARWSDARLRLATDFWMRALTQVLVVGLPEEYFFRGYVQTRLELVWPPGRRLMGARVGRALVVAAALFALGHLLVDFNGMRLAVFFPGLVFGWMRSYSGSILAPVLFHASSNMISEVLHRSFGR